MKILIISYVKFCINSIIKTVEWKNRFNLKRRSIATEFESISKNNYSNCIQESFKMRFQIKKMKIKSSLPNIDIESIPNRFAIVANPMLRAEWILLQKVKFNICALHYFFFQPGFAFLQRDWSVLSASKRLFLARKSVFVLDGKTVKLNL